MPAIPAPRMMTDFPTPAFAGQSPGRGDGTAGRGVGVPGASEEALDEPHPGTAATSPIAAIVLSIAALPAARPMPFRKSRRAILPVGAFICARPGRAAARPCLAVAFY